MQKFKNRDFGEIPKIYSRLSVYFPCAETREVEHGIPSAEMLQLMCMVMQGIMDSNNLNKHIQRKLGVI